MARIAYRVPALVEVVRSFSYKLALPGYENMDFFCSQKKECKEADVDEVSEQLYQFCRTQVFNAVNQERKARGIKEHTLSKTTPAQAAGRSA